MIAGGFEFFGSRNPPMESKRFSPSYAVVSPLFHLALDKLWAPLQARLAGAAGCQPPTLALQSLDGSGLSPKNPPSVAA